MPGSVVALGVEAALIAMSWGMRSAFAAIVEGESRLWGRPSTIVIPSALLSEVEAHLAEWVKPGPDALVFTGVKGGPLRRPFFGVEWRRVVAEVGMEGFHFHDLRHTGNTLAAAVPGTTTKDLMARMGHRSSRAALIYQHATKDKDRAIADGLSRLLEDRANGSDS